MAVPDFWPIDFRLLDERLSTPDLIILNQPIPPGALLPRLWDCAQYRICADGGANRLYDHFETHLVGQRDKFLPDMIHGDLDSLRPDVRDYYAQRNVKISKVEDEYSTDFQKALAVVHARCDEQRIRRMWKNVDVIGGIAGRIDQGLNVLHQILLEAEEGCHITLFSEESLSTVLRSGEHRIQYRKRDQPHTAYAGILPLAGEAVISTEGFRWDVKKWPTSIGGKNLTTHNIIDARILKIHTDASVIFTISLHDK